VGGVAEPDAAPGGFDGAGQGAIVDQLAADAGDTLDTLHRRARHQNGSTRSGSEAAVRVGDPGEGVQHLEEEYESWDQGALGRGLTVEADHLGYEVEMGGLDLGDQGGEMALRVLDVCVGKQEVIGGLRPGVGKALMYGPKLAAPAWRQRLTGNDIEPWTSAKRSGDRGGAVGAVVVDQNDREVTGIILCEQGADAPADVRSFVARGDNRDDLGGPRGRSGAKLWQ